METQGPICLFAGPDVRRAEAAALPAGGKLSAAADDIPIVFSQVGVQAAAAILASVGQIDKAAAAGPAQWVEGAEAEQTVEVLGVRAGVAGEIFTGAVRKVGVFCSDDQVPPFCCFLAR